MPELLELWVWNIRQQGGEPDQRIPLPVGARLVVGRSPDADVPVPSMHLSRRHFEVRRDEAGVWVTDLHTLSGTWVNDRQIRGPTLLRPCGTITHADMEARVIPITDVDSHWLRWNDGTVVRLARSIYEARRWTDMPILADALPDAGCDNEEFLSHAREQGVVHVRGCWLLDLLLNKE